jgi:integrase
MNKARVDIANKLVFIADSKTPTGISEVPLTDMAFKAFQDQIELAGPGPWLFPSSRKPKEHQTDFRKTWQRTLQRAGVPYFRLYDLRSTYATRLSAGGVPDEWVTQMLRQTDAKVFKKYSQMKLQMKREALTRLNRKAGDAELPEGFDTEQDE